MLSDIWGCKFSFTLYRASLFVTCCYSDGTLRSAKVEVLPRAYEYTSIRTRTFISYEGFAEGSEMTSRTE